MNVHKGTLSEEAGAQRLDASEVGEFLSDNPNIQYVDCVFADLCGNVRGMRIARAELERVFADGLAVPSSIYFLDARGEVAGDAATGVVGTAWPVKGTLTRVNWSQRPHGQVQMTLHDAAGSPYFGEPRNVLKRVLARFGSLDIVPVVGAALQFYLADRERAKSGALQQPASLDAAIIAAIDADIAEAARVQGVSSVAFGAAHGVGQREVAFAAACDGVKAADDLVYLRQVVRAVVRQHKRDATFMAKPFVDLPGSGMRFQVGMRRGEQSVFASADGGGLVRAAVGGMQAVMAESFALFAPSSNAFRRFSGARALPRNKRWGYLNGSTNISVGRGADEAPLIDVVTASADANPYLALAAILAGVHCGISRGLDAGAPAEGDVGGLADPTLPATIDAALLALENGSVLREYFGPAYVDLYCAAKRTELERFRHVIPAHEYDWYL